MIDDPKEKNYDVDGQSVLSNRSKNGRGVFSKIGVLIYSGNMLQLTAACLLVTMGAVIVGVALLGLMQPLWLSTVLSMLGSVSAMVGIYIFYNLFSDKSTFDTLVNKAIQRVIRNQN